ncbi:MAG: 5'-nucleotidase C-terminal domain-containing protein [Salibacteraceae bacterium]|nr:5'-nucleotidase C-terminal domain-containing protein [Salibacteraceae bacterium]
MNRLSTILYLAALFLLFSCQEPVLEYPQADVVIVQVNDIYEIDGVNQGKRGNLARVQGLVDSLKKVYPQVLLVHAGDFLNPSLIGNLKDESGEKVKGKHMVDVMNAMSFDAVAFGNHEIDLNYPTLKKRLNEMNFDMISANLFFKDSSEIRAFRQNEKEVKGYKNFEISTKSGLRTLSLLSVILPYNKKDYVHYKNVNSTIQSNMIELKEKADGVFLLTHLNRSEDNELGEKFQEINLIMGGHDHYNFCDTLGSERYLTKADANARTAWVHYVSWNDNSKEFLSKSVLVDINNEIKKNIEVESIIEKWKQFTIKKTSEQGYQMLNVLMEIERPLDVREESIRSQQTDFGKLVCEAMASTFDTADIVVLNSGSIRYDDLMLNPVTEGDILKALPFGGVIKGAYVSGADLMKIYEAGKLNEGSGGYLQVLQIPKGISEFGMYFLVTTSYVSAGLEKNLGFMKDFEWKAPKDLDEGENDIRKVLIEYLVNSTTI